ncbi:MAG: putative viral replication protein [Cressdnaviricota sp.]|nr:MAG: putative viral replication protein [Cressdnaviricota sp.]
MSRAPFMSPKMHIPKNSKLSTTTPQQQTRHIVPTAIANDEDNFNGFFDSDGDATDVIEQDENIVYGEMSMNGIKRYKTLKVDWEPTSMSQEEVILDRKYFNKPSLDYIENPFAQVYKTQSKYEDQLKNDSDFSEVEDEGIQAGLVLKRTHAQMMEDEIATKDEDKQVPMKTKNQGRLVTRYCFTWNNPSISGDELKEHMEANNLFACGVFQLEEGDNKVKHFQGYVELTKRAFVSGVHLAMKPYQMHWEYANGSKIQNHKYCTKEESQLEGPWYVKLEKDFFLGKKGQGRRSDLDEFAEAAYKAGGVNEELFEQYPGYAMKHAKQAKDLVNALALRKAKEDEKVFWKEEARRRAAGEATRGQQQRKLELYFGPTAAGKTTKIKETVIGIEGKDLYTKNCANRWWCGYEGEEAILMDEFRGDSFGQMEEFNNITNLGALQVECKGGNTVLLANEMHFASNRHPVHWWKKNATSYYNWDDVRYRAVVRRFAIVHWWNEAGVYTKLENPGIQKDTREWRTAYAAWKAFWVWNARPVEEGDVVDTADLPGYFDLITSPSSE